MKLTIVLLTAVFLNASATGIAQHVNFKGKNIPLLHVFTEVEKQTGFVFIYTSNTLENIRPVSIEAKNIPLDEFLQMLFADQPIKFTIDYQTILLSRKEIVAKTKTGLPDNIAEFLNDSKIDVSGKVLDNLQRPLQGVNVTVRGTQSGTATNQNGEFILRNIDEKAILVFSYVGFELLREKLNGRSYITINMTPENKQLEEAIVYNGYQKIKQKYLTGSVTSLKMDSILQPGFNTVDKMLEGRVPGLTFMQNSGQSGAAPKLRIRGTSTIIGTREPLWVVDGIIRTNPIPIPADRVNDPDFVNLLGNAISGLNPADIDQIDVLKDAAAAALYGVRASNGVIVITTKRGKPGPPTINYNVTSTYSRRPRYSDNAINMMNSQERVDVSREMINKGMTLRGGALEAYEKAIVDYNGGLIDYNTFMREVSRAELMNTDWMGITMRDAFATNHTLSISGGSSAATYRASAGYQTEPGVIKKEVNNRYTASMNLQLNHRKFQADFNIQMNKGKRRYTPQEVGLLSYAYGTSRAIPAYNEDGTPYFHSTISSNTLPTMFYDFKTMNIINEMEHSGETIESDEYTASAYLNYEIAKGIQLNSTLSYTGGNAIQQTWFDDKTEWAAKIRAPSFNAQTGTFIDSTNILPFGGQLQQKEAKRQNYNIKVRLDYRKFLDRREKHQLTAAIGSEIISNHNNVFDHTSRGYYPGRGHSFANIDLSKYAAYRGWLQENGSGTITIQKENSFRTFLTSTYVFNNRYIITASTSQEYSNAFGSRSNEKFLPTWALSGRWNLENDLFKNQSWLDMAALRVSVGTQGNMPGQSAYTIIKKGPIDNYYNAFGSTIASIPNPDLLWEKVNDYNGSMEFSLWNGKVRGSLGYFYKKTTNALLPQKVSTVNGISSYLVNGGIVENQGVEIDLHFRLINNAGKGNRRGFTWRFDPQLGQVFNKLLNTSLNSRNVLVDAAALTYFDFLNGTVPVNGKSINTFYSYQFKTLDPRFGFPVFNGAEPENAATYFDKYNKLTREEVYSLIFVESGRREPVLQGSFNNSFSYRNWRLEVMLTYSIGNKVRLMQIASGNYGTFRPSSQQNLRKEFTERWRHPGDEMHTNIPAIQGAQYVEYEKYAWWVAPATSLVNNRFAQDYYQMYDFSDLRVVKGDYLKLQSVALSYMLPSQLCSAWHIKGASINLTGSNLFTIANKQLRGQDPSQSGSAPNINLSIRPVYAFNINLSF